MPEIPQIDAVCVAAALALWQAFAFLVDKSRWAPSSLSATVNRMRHDWMMRLTDREGRIVDTSLLGSLMHSVSFFASTTVIIMGGVVALLGAVDRGYEAMHSLPFMPAISKELFAAKLLLLLAIFIYSFLKFTWSLRQFNYCCILIGGAPFPAGSDQEKRDFAARAARVNSLGARSFNEGLRGYYFALASLGWFIHPVAFVIGAVIVVLVLWRREFHSRTRRALRGQHAERALAETR